MRVGQWRRAVAGSVLGGLLVAGIATEAAAEERGYWAEAGLGVGSVLANVAYMPAKITYAALGTVTGGLAYALTGGSYETAQNVWTASLGGSYVVVPDMLTGERPLQFAGAPEVAGKSIVEEPMSVARDPGVPAEYPIDTQY